MLKSGFRIRRATNLNGLGPSRSHATATRKPFTTLAQPVTPSLHVPPPRAVSHPTAGVSPARTEKPPPFFTHSLNTNPFKLHLGGTLPSVDVAYESWGTLNERRDNVILLTTGLSASPHAKSHAGNRKDGWWENFIGPGLPLDTNKYHIICTNVIGGCFGSTGPSSIDPIATHQNGSPTRYGLNFPMVTVWDMVRAQFQMLDALGIPKVHGVVGSSMGGMQALAAAALFPDKVDRVVSISAAARSHPYSIALRHAQRQVLMSDPNWQNGNYYDSDSFPSKGLGLARQIGTITYRSGPEWEMRFGRKRADPNAKRGFKSDFMIETYLEHQGKKWQGQYDPNSLLYISRAMDMFDMAERPLVDPYDFDVLQGPPSQQLVDVANDDDHTQTDYTHTQHLINGMSPIKCPVLVIGVKSDFLIPSWQQKEIATCLREGGNHQVTHFEIDGVYGHDTFLLDFSNVGSAVKGHLEIDIRHPVPEKAKKIS
ncbi:homoserine O-acetyltransferase [Chytriomyces confervae]|uniref:Homoserine O-acetyltransferase n=1 Tax=Chytriomyces confervae TaxID=246404 RepID=A0A507FD84_9FUNG|nr:homoserine O-acetyltransferase [Chytriomyces confervae]